MLDTEEPGVRTAQDTPVKGESERSGTNTADKKVTAGGEEVGMSREENSIRDTVIYEAIRKWHQTIPASFMLQFINNIQSYYEIQADESGDVAAGCGCSGTGIWHRDDIVL